MEDIIMIIFENSLPKQESAKDGTWTQDGAEMIVTSPAKETRRFKLQYPKSMPMQNLLNHG